MSGSTRAAKRRRTSYDPVSPSAQPASTPIRSGKTRRSQQRHNQPNGDANDHIHPLADDTDELAIDDPPVPIETPSRPKRSAKVATPASQAGKSPVSRANKSSKSRSSKTAQEHQITTSPLVAAKKTRAKQSATLDDDEALEAPHATKDDSTPSYQLPESAPTAPHPGLEILKRVVLDKLVGHRPTPLRGLDEERQKVHSLLHQTVTAGEGNSMLVIGARGTGKTTLVNGLLEELSQDNREHFHVIRLNGFIHTDDKLALREIWRQLGREMEVEDEGPTNNYADTLAKLLALLSHPAELSAEADPDKVAKSVVFILDEFDLFASHPRQTLLYNLFDVAQSRKAPIAVLGLTTRVEIAESLEKRVKSRFSHRYVHLGLAKHFNEFTEICRHKLLLQLEDLTFDERLELAKPNNNPNKASKKSPKPTSAEDLLNSWNVSVGVLLQTPRVATHLARIYHTTRSIPTALASFILPISLLTEPTAAAMDLSLLSATHPPDSKLALLSALPTLALALLIAAARLDIILDTDLCNFNMAYDEYVSLTAAARIAASASSSAAVSSAATLGGRVWSRATARGMWASLAELELLVPAAGGRSLLDGGVVALPDTEMVRCDVALEEIEGAVPDLERGLAKWCREI